MKRLISAFLIASMLLSLSACTGGGYVSGETESDTGRTDSVPTESATVTAMEEIPQDPASLDDIATYQNPIFEVGDRYTWPDYGVGDPFVMRYNGRYYLYCSTKDGQIGIQCWQSDDLVTWIYKGFCAKESLTRGAYAPEVVYNNGSFYMYTSPEGKGHYVLKSDSPTGPFVAVTENFGLSIDGDVFIDDDGSWYFYCAAYDGIMVYPMIAPDKVDASRGTLIPCDLNGWTEGSMVVKHNGIYYITYTGNHVWSAGYRIHYAVSGFSPTSFKTVKNNPLLLSTDRDRVMGIGHSSTVLGPNLDEYYIVYHSFETVPQRNTNIDRIVFNGSDTYVLGATTDKQVAPAMPDLYCRFEAEDELDAFDITGGSLLDGRFTVEAGAEILSKEALQSDYTAEYNFTSLHGKAGILFSYRDPENYGSAVYDSAAGILKITLVTGGQAQSDEIPLKASFGESLNLDALLLFTVRKSGGVITLSVNNRAVYQCESTLGGGKIGITAESGSATLGFVGGTNGVYQSTLKDVYKPIDSTVSALLSTEQNAKTKKSGTVSYLCASASEQYTYKTNVTCGGLYDLIFAYRATETCVIEISDGETVIGVLTLDPSSNKVTDTLLRGLTLNEGLRRITFSVKEGSAELLHFTFHRAENVTDTIYDFSGKTDVSYQDGSWSCTDGSLVLKSDYGKYMVGSEGWGDYAVEADITVTARDMNAGICIRVSNPATGEGTNLVGGSNFLQGYFIGIGNGSIFLGKQNYDWTELDRVSLPLTVGETYTVRGEAIGNLLKISVNGHLLITYTDKDSPFLHGMAGFRAHQSSLCVEELRVYAVGDGGA